MDQRSRHIPRGQATPSAGQPSGPLEPDRAPHEVLAAAAAVRSEQGTRPDQLARIRTRSGRWLSLAACPLGGGRVAVVLQPATTNQLLPAMAAWHKFTPRQLEVLCLLLEARPIKQIARRLNLSPHTVEDRR